MHCCCGRKVEIWEFSFFLLTSKTEWALVYCLYILQLAAQTVQMNWIFRLGRYLMVVEEQEKSKEQEEQGRQEEELKEVVF